MNIRTRFTLLFAIIVVIILFFFSFAIYYLSENFRQNDFHSRLQDRAIVRLKLVVEEQSKSENIFYNLPQSNKNTHSSLQENIIIFDHSLNILYKDSLAAIPTPDNIKLVLQQKIFPYSQNNNETIGFVYPYKDKTYILFASAHDDYGKKFITNLKKILLFRGIIMMLIIVFCGWFFVGFFLRPISKLVQQADKITYSNINYRLSTANKDDEIGQLTSTFNKMLDRLETSFKIQKRFVSNASHELRNPLAAISGQIDVSLMKDRSKDDYKQVLTSVSKDIKNIITLSNNLLELANSEVETVFQELDEVRIDEVLWSIREEFSKLKPDYAVYINFDTVVENEKLLTCKGKEHLLKVAFTNLIDNACKFSEDKKVQINVTTTNQNIILFFIDQGIGIPDAFLNQIFEPFFRGQNTHGIPGNGIGLSLVYRIIKLHSGKIFIRSKINKGTTVEIVLPNLC